MEPISFRGVTSERKFPQDICRLCSIECQSELKNVFQKNILEMLDLSFSFCPSQDYELPKGVCELCFESLTRSYQFKIQIIATESLLKEKLKHFVPDMSQNILDIALHEAEIKAEQNGISQETLDVISEEIPAIKTDKITESNDVYSDVETSVSIHIMKDPPDLKEDSNAHIVTKKNDDLKSTDIPPLVPIQHTENSKRILLKQALSQEPPPLVPLKPVSDESALSKINEQSATVEIECEKISPSDRLSKCNNIEIHEPTKFLFCNICRKEFNNGKKLIGHLKGHMISKDFSCKICGKKYPNPSTFQIHMRSHTGERPFKCPVCDKGFTRWAGVVSHMQTHEDNRPFKCEHCDQSFKILSNLERHKVLHSDVLPFCCNYCGKTFSQSTNLQLHIRTYHTNEKSFLCSECGKRFVTSTRLNRHMAVHTGNKPFVCKLCSKPYSNAGDLRYHERSVHGDGESEKPYACDLCDKRFFYSCRLSNHMKTHQKVYACNQCSISFTSSDGLEQHTKRKHPDDDSSDVSESKVIIVIE